MSEDLRARFFPIEINEEQADSMDAVRIAIANAASAVDQYAPDGREKALALTKLEEATFWAVRAIAKGGQ